MRITRPAALAAAALTLAACSATATSTPSTTASSHVSMAAHPSASVPGQLTSDGWTLVSSRIVNAEGTFGGDLRVRNNGGTARTGAITLTILAGADGQKVVGVLIGTAPNVPPGAVATAEMVSTDTYVNPTPDRLDFAVSSF